MLHFPTVHIIVYVLMFFSAQNVKNILFEFLFIASTLFLCVFLVLLIIFFGHAQSLVSSLFLPFSFTRRLKFSCPDFSFLVHVINKLNDDCYFNRYTPNSHFSWDHLYEFSSTSTSLSLSLNLILKFLLLFFHAHHLGFNWKNQLYHLLIFFFFWLLLWE